MCLQVHILYKTESRGTLVIPYCGIWAKQGNVGDFAVSWWQMQETHRKGKPRLRCSDSVHEDRRLLPVPLTAGPEEDV